jgi:hypothetical protein
MTIDEFVKEKNLKEIGVGEFLQLKKDEKIFFYYPETERNSDYVESGYFKGFETIKFMDHDENDIDFRISYTLGDLKVLGFTHKKTCFATQVRMFKEK